MLRNTWKPALALGAVLATSGAVSAADRDTIPLFGGSSSTTMTLGGQGTAAQAATEDNELTHGYKYRYGGYRGGYGFGYYGGYRGYYGGYGGYRGYGRHYAGYGGYYGGYRGGYYGGYRGYGYAGYYGGYRPYYGGYSSFSYYQPAYYSSYYASYPVYSAYYDCGPSIYLGVGGATGIGAPVVTLGTDFARPAEVAQPAPEAAQPMVPPSAPGNGTFPYDGGPANPVPLPKADPNAMPPVNPALIATDLPISLKPKSAVSPYRYKAYGEK
jgi:hypothetical protein